MKELNKWWRKTYAKQMCKSMGDSPNYKEEAAWKAALEWVMETFNSNIYVSDNTDDMSKVVNIYDMVHKELNGKTKKRHNSSISPCS